MPDAQSELLSHPRPFAWLSAMSLPFPVTVVSSVPVVTASPAKNELADVKTTTTSATASTPTKALRPHLRAERLQRRPPGSATWRCAGKRLHPSRREQLQIGDFPIAHPRHAPQTRTPDTHIHKIAINSARTHRAHSDARTVHHTPHAHMLTDDAPAQSDGVGRFRKPHRISFPLIFMTAPVEVLSFQSDRLP